MNAPAAATAPAARVVTDPLPISAAPGRLGREWRADCGSCFKGATVQRVSQAAAGVCHLLGVRSKSRRVRRRCPAHCSNGHSYERV